MLSQGTTARCRALVPGRYLDSQNLDSKNRVRVRVGLVLGLVMTVQISTGNPCIESLGSTVIGNSTIGKHGEVNHFTSSSVKDWCMSPHGITGPPYKSSRNSNLPMQSSGQITWVPCAVELDVRSGRGLIRASAWVRLPTKKNYFK